jgi:hypothetical protein
MKVQHTIFASVGIALLYATVTFAQQVKTDYDRGTDFSQIKTYSWEKVQTQDQLLVNRIKQAVNAALASKGLTPVDSGGDVAIVAMEMNKDHQTVNTWYDGLGGFGGFGGGWRWGGGFGGMGELGESTSSVEHYQVGTLVVDMFNAKTKNLIWRGSASDTLSSKSAKNIKDLDKGVQKMFDHFPPGGSK